LGWALGAVSAAACNAAFALAPVDVLQRPAELLRAPQRGVYLAATRAGERIVAVGERGAIVVSDDGGVGWRQVPSPVSATLTGVQFASAKSGWAIGHYGVVLGTRDGGDTWTLLLDGRRAAQATLDAAKASADASALSQKRLADAQRLVADGPDKPFLDLLFVDDQVGFVVGAYNLILRTQDGGKHWQSIADRLDNPKGLHLYTIAAEGTTLYIAGEQGLLLRSDDGGAQFGPNVRNGGGGSWLPACSATYTWACEKNGIAVTLATPMRMALAPAPAIVLTTASYCVWYVGTGVTSAGSPAFAKFVAAPSTSLLPNHALTNVGRA